MPVPPRCLPEPGHLANNTLCVIGKVTQATTLRTPCAPSLVEDTLSTQEHTAGLGPGDGQAHLQFRTRGPGGHLRFEDHSDPKACGFLE